MTLTTLTGPTVPIGSMNVKKEPGHKWMSI